METVLHNIAFIAALVDANLTDFLIRHSDWLYTILFMIVFAETGFVFFPFLPGDSLLFAAGTLASSGKAHIGAVCMTLWIAAVLGNSSNYWIGRWFGKRAMKWENSRFFNKETFDRTHAFYRKHGGKTIIIARFIPFARTFAPFVAGVARMDYANFIIKDLIGATLWVSSLTLGGYWFGKMPIVKDNLGIIVFSMLSLSLIPIIIAVWKLRRGLQP